MLHLHPNLVGEHTTIDPVHVELSDVVRDGVAAHSPSGVLGDPRTASADLGAAIIADWVTQLAQHVEHVLT
jgi:creatinine amidohydrolase/Fe(II)-dependent formamide hydrolase-like protein